MYPTATRPDMISVLSGLAGILNNQSDAVDLFLQQTGTRQVVNPFRYRGKLQIGDPVPDGFWQTNGIRRIVLDHVHFGPAAADISVLLGGCSIIEFADWADVDDASGSWQGLYSRVIKPLGKRDFEFIFHLGDAARRRVFEVDEVLDIIGDYSSYGRVTVILDYQEADSLWCRLNGQDPGSFVADVSGAHDRYLSVFNTTNIDSLNVLCSSLAVHFSRDSQFRLGKGPSAGAAVDETVRFSAGYQLGLLLGLDALHSTTLGLAVSAGYSGAGSAINDFLIGINIF